MINNFAENNNIVLIGKITSEKAYSHEIYGERFYTFNIEVLRLSGSADSIPVTISERLITKKELTIGDSVIVKGQFRSYNSYENERSRLVLTVFAKEIIYPEDTEEIEEIDENEITQRTTNEVVLDGFICKKPIYRQTPFGREIADILIAVNRSYNKSDYIPCIAWGRNAKFCENLSIGVHIKVWGRVQSREYEKKFENGEVQKRVAYEVSINRLEICKDDEEIKEEHENVEAM